MNQITAIVDGKRCTMLTEESMEGAERSCRDRFGARFQGFEAVPVETLAKMKWNEYRNKKISRPELEAWLAQQYNEAELRAIFNAMRGGMNG